MTTGKKIQVADYNAIRTKVVGVVGTGSTDTGYGYPLNSTAVTTTSRIRKSDWTKLGQDITNARRHQTGTDPTLLDLSIGSKVKSDPTTQYFSAYDTLADQVVTDKNLVNATSTINITPVTRLFANDAPWYNLITCTVTVEFDSEANARSYFNTGGEIRFSSSRTDPSGVNPDADRARQNTSWSTLLTNITNGTGGYSVPRFGGRLPSSGTTPTNGENYYRLTGTYQQWYTDSPPTTAPGTQLPDFGVNNFVIKARFPDISNKGRIEFRVEWQDNFQADYKFDDGITGQFSLGVTLVKPITFALAGFDGSFTEIETPEVTIDEISITADTEPAVPDPPSYSFTQDKTEINETSGGIGNVVTYTINTTNVTEGTVLYWRIFGTAAASDFDPQTLTGSSSVVNPYPDPNGTATIAITARSDATSEPSPPSNTENFTLRVYDTETGRNNDTIANRIANTNQVTINDTSKGTPTLAVTILADGSVIANNSEVNEGTSLTFNIATTNIDNGASIPFSITGDVSTADFDSPNQLTGTSINVSSDGGYTGSATLQKTVRNDISPFQSPLVAGAEGDPETMTVTFSYPGATNAVRTVRIRDTSFLPAPAISITGAQWSPGTVYIGNSSTLSYTANNVSKADALLSGGSVINTTTPPSGSTTINFSQSFSTGSGFFPNTGTYGTTIKGTSAFEPGTTQSTSSFNLQVDPVPTPQVNSLTWSPSSYVAPGSSTLSWTTTGANYVNISLPSYSGNYPASSSLTVTYSTGGTYTATVYPKNGPEPGFPAALTPTTYTGPSRSESVVVSTTTPPPPPAHKINFGFGSAYNSITLGFAVIRGTFTWSTKTHSLGMSGSGPNAVYNVPSSSRIFVQSTTGSGNVTVSTTSPSPQTGGTIDYYNDVGTFPVSTSWQYTINSMTSTGGGPTSTTKFCPNGTATAYPWYLRVRASGYATSLSFQASWTDGGVAQTRNITGSWVASYDDETFRQEATRVMADFVPGETWTSTHQSRAITIKNQLYESNSLFIVNFGDGPTQRWGLFRTAEVYGPFYWARESVNTGQDPTGEIFRSRFFGGVTGGDATRSQTSAKSFDDGGIRIYGSWRDRY